MVYLSSIYESMQEKLTAKVYLSVAVAKKQFNERRLSSGRFLGEDETEWKKRA